MEQCPACRIVYKVIRTEVRSTYPKVVSHLKEVTTGVVEVRHVQDLSFKPAASVRFEVERTVHKNGIQKLRLALQSWYIVRSTLEVYFVRRTQIGNHREKKRGLDRYRESLESLPTSQGHTGGRPPPPHSLQLPVRAPTITSS